MSKHLLTQDEIRSAFRRYTGKVQRVRPPVGQKSTKICKRDLHLLCGIHRFGGKCLKDFELGTYSFGKKLHAKISRIVKLVDEGRITKTQYGAYHFWDEAPKKPQAIMQVNLSTMKLGNVPVLKQEKKFPNFNDLFRKK